MEDRLCFLLLALIASKSLGTNAAVLSSFFPTFQCAVVIINPVIHNSHLVSLPWATHLLFKKRDAKHCLKGYAHTIAQGKKKKNKLLPSLATFNPFRLGNTGLPAEYPAL